eukprot:COSAG04_NODE_1566_length_6320_cov_15.884102_6_plen_51_part_00
MRLQEKHWQGGDANGSANGSGSGHTVEVDVSSSLSLLDVEPVGCRHLLHF